MPSRAWIDYPGHIWVQRANEGAIYSPDGFTLQFDHGTIWQRAPLVPPPPRRLFEVAGKVAEYGSARVGRLRALCDLIIPQPDGVSRASAVIILPVNSYATGRTSQTAHIAPCEGLKASPPFRTRC